MKIRQDKDVTHHTSAINTENETKLSWLIESSAICDKTRQDNNMTR